MAARQTANNEDGIVFGKMTTGRHNDDAIF